MTERVDFYVLTSTAARQRLTFACRLTEKAYLRDLNIVIWSDNAGDVSSMDELLWVFDDRSFIPHGIAGDTPVRLTADLDAVAGADLLVNLAGSLPPNLARFARIAEIIDGDEERRRLGRERFKAYRDLKLPVETHRT